MSLADDILCTMPPPAAANARVVRALDEAPALTPRQLANRKYRQSAKGKAAAARTLARSRANAEWRAKQVARMDRWRADATNRLHVNALRRVHRRRAKNQRQQGEQ